MVTDARSNTKVWVTDHWLDANITKDNGTDLASTACMYAYPNYPLTLEFRAPSAPVNGLVLIHEPNSTARTGHDKYIAGYDEHLDIEIATVDSVGVTGTKLWWKMVAELRRIFENYPFGSLRIHDRMVPTTERVGSTVLYSGKVTLVYRRGTT